MLHPTVRQDVLLGRSRALAPTRPARDRRRPLDPRARRPSPARPLAARSPSRAPRADPLCQHRQDAILGLDDLRGAAPSPRSTSTTTATAADPRRPPHAQAGPSAGRSSPRSRSTSRRRRSTRCRACVGARARAVPLALVSREADARPRWVQTHAQAFPYLTSLGKAVRGSAFSLAADYTAPREVVADNRGDAQTGGGDVPALTWHVFDESEPFELFGVRVTPLPGACPLLPPR